MMSAKEILKRLKKLDCPPEERYSHYPEALKIVVNLPNIFVRKEFPYNQVCVK